MEQYKYIFFDFDGTICASAPGIIDSVVYALNEQDIEIPDEKILLKFIGPPLAESFKNILGMDGEQSAESIKKFRAYFREKGIWNSSMYPGIPDTLNRLKNAGKRLVVATSKPDVFANQLLERFGILHYFDFVSGSLMDSKRTTKREVIEYALQQLGIEDTASVLMVGDRCFDVEGAKSFGIDCMGVLFGYGSEEELKTSGAKYIAATTSDVADLILS